MYLLAIGWGHPWFLEATLSGLPLVRPLCRPPCPHTLKLLEEVPMPFKGSFDWVRTPGIISLLMNSKTTDYGS